MVSIIAQRDYMDKEERMEKQFLKAVEISQVLGTSRSKAYEIIASGELPSVLIAGCRRVPVPAFNAYIAEKMKHSTARLDGSELSSSPSPLASTKTTTKPRSRRRR